MPLDDERFGIGTKSPWAAEVAGFNIHAGVTVRAGDRDGLEKLRIGEGNGFAGKAALCPTVGLTESGGGRSRSAAAWPCWEVGACMVPVIAVPPS